jgi:hypothetical protein
MPAALTGSRHAPAKIPPDRQHLWFLVQMSARDPATNADMLLSPSTF